MCTTVVWWEKPETYHMDSTGYPAPSGATDYTYFYNHFPCKPLPEEALKKKKLVRFYLKILQTSNWQ